MGKDKNIELLGMGNGLIDIQYQLDYDEFLRLNLSKGEMRLISIEKQKALYNLLSNYVPNICSGGASANSIIAFSQFGGKSAYFTALGNDEFGKYYSQDFLKLDIDLYASYNNELPTGTCLVIITPDYERTMLTCLGASSTFNTENIKEEIIQDSQWFYIEGFKLSEQKSTEAVFYAIELAKKYKTKIAFNLSDLFIISNNREKILEILKNTDLLFCNKPEALLLTETNDEEKAFLKMKEIVPNYCLTLGENGAIVYYDSQRIDIKPYKTNAIDTTGAGDMFAGAFLYGLIKWNSPEKAGKFASYASSVVVSQLGARLNEDNLKKIQHFILNEL